MDILHEFEIGVWKKLFVHLIRILESLSRGRSAATLSAELNLRWGVNAFGLGLFIDASVRYRSVPSFGRDTVRKFPLNVSEMKRKAARDYEDLLQVSLPLNDRPMSRSHMTNSVRYPHLKGCYRRNTMADLQNFSSFALSGTHWQSCVYIVITLSHSWISPRFSSVLR